MNDSRVTEETDLITSNPYRVLEQELQAIITDHQQLSFNPKKEESNTLTGLSSTSLKRASFLGPNRLQSQLFTVSRTVNPLVAAAAPLLTLATRLGELNTSPELTKLYEQLCHEVSVFEYKAQSLGYKPQVVIAARYLLCSLIDETIQHSLWGEDSDWKEKNLLNSFQNERDGGERCFHILNRSLEDPILYFDLIELFYLCFSFGLEGKHRGSRNGHDEITEIMDKLYQLIREHRGEPCRKLLIEHQSINPPKKVLRWHLPPVWLTVSFGFMILAAIYWPYHTHLQQLSAPVDEALKTLIPAEKTASL